MTIAAMHNAFKVGLNKLDTFHSLQFEPEEIDLLLNQAQDVIIKTRFEYQNIYRNRTFEGSQKRIDDLRPLIERSSITPASTATANEYTVALPATYRFFISGTCRLECGTTFVSGGTGSASATLATAELLQTTHDKIERIKNDPFNKADFKKIPFIIEKNTIYLYCITGFFPIRFDLTYLDTPVQMAIGTSTTSELPDHIHNEIVNEAISMALERSADPRYQTMLNELNKQE